MTATATAPKWALELLGRACAGRATPTVFWHHSTDTPRFLMSPPGTFYRRGRARFDANKAFTGGYVENDAIHIYHGWLHKDQRLVLLHELAHWLTKEGHTARFWDVAWDLYLRYMPRSIDYILKREAHGLTGSLRAAVRAGVLTAHEATTRADLRRFVALRG